jgi:iron complex outermembrane recepter protein
MMRLKVSSISVSLAIATLFAAGQSFAQSNVQAATAAAPAAATPAPGTAPGSELQEVTVSASAISIAGYEAPTPVTAVGLAQLQSNAYTDIGDQVRNLPAFAASPSPENSDYTGLVTAGIQGEDLLNLRNLGINRTLVLVDGQRVVLSNIQGGVDVSTFPQSLIERVDTVTGGASATWGSDALAGVVNFILNKNFNGIEANAEYSNNTQYLHAEEKLELTAGTGFDDDRGHVEVSGSWWNIPNPYFTHDVPGWNSPRLVANPACSNYNFESATCPQGQPVWLHGTAVGLATETTGGLISGCQTPTVAPFNSFNQNPQTIYPCGLSNIGFGPQGVPYVFNPGNVSNGFFSNGGTLNDEKGFIGLDGQPIRNETAFFLGSFKISDTLTASLQLNYGTTSTTNNSYTPDQYGGSPGVTIYSGNPYIPPSIQSYMTANGIPAFNLGTSDDNNFPGGGGSLGSEMNTLGVPIAFVHRIMQRGVFTLDGSIGPKWTWEAYYMHGQSNMYENALNNTDIPNLVEAENVVTGPGGVPTCAVNLNPALAIPGASPGCVPLNVMGEGVASQAAINWINGPTRNGLDAQRSTLKEDVASFKAQGELPFGLQGGPIAAAAGALYRAEHGIQINCGVNCTDANYSLMNFASFGPAGYDIKEANAELNIPIVKNMGVQSLSADLAGRVSDYSTSGTVETYKFGVLSQVNDWLRFRASYSYDIRAPDLFELFSSPTPILSNGTDPRLLTSVTFYGTTEGNANVKPEDGEQKTFGLVFTPVQGMNISIDYYDLLIKNLINEGFGSTEIEALCEAGIATYCEDLMFGHYPGGCTGPTLDTCPKNEALAAVFSIPLNSDEETTSGLDFNGDYRFPFRAGALDFNSSANYMFDERYVSRLQGIQCDTAGSIGNDLGLYCGGLSGVPKFRGSLAATYTQGGWLVTVQERMIGAAHLYTGWVSGVNVDNNDIPFYWYTDLRASYKFDNGLTVYGAIDDLMDKVMPIVGDTPNSITIFDTPYRDDVYDGYGRVFRVGLRYRLGG